MKFVYKKLLLFSLLINSCNKDRAEEEATTEAVVKQVTHNVMTSDQLNTEIDEMVIPYINLENDAVLTALHLLIQRGREMHPERGFRFPHDFSSLNPHSKKTISLQAREVSFKDALTKICEKADLEWEVSNGEIIVKEKAQP